MVSRSSYAMTFEIWHSRMRGASLQPTQLRRIRWLTRPVAPFGQKVSTRNIMTTSKTEGLPVGSTVTLRSCTANVRLFFSV